MSARATLANRRPHESASFVWGGHEYEVGVGFDQNLSGREIFVSGSKIGSEMSALLDDACVALSLLLQHGVAIATMSKHLGREGPDSTDAASVLGEAVRLAARIESDVIAMQKNGDLKP